MITRRHVLVAVVAACATLGVVVAPARTDKKPVMGSAIFEWEAVAVKEQKTGARRQFFQAPTATLDELECHATTLNPGESPHAPHRHVEEEIMVVKEGTVEALAGGETRRAGPGSVIFQASNQLHGLRNVGTTQATYHVFKWKTPGAPRAASALRSAVFDWGLMKATPEKYGARRVAPRRAGFGRLRGVEPTARAAQRGADAGGVSRHQVAHARHAESERRVSGEHISDFGFRIDV